jgi:SAM-dependent methyltransferase
MTSLVMDIHGQCLLDYLNGEKEAFYLLHMDDGFVTPPMYAKQFFYENDQFPEIDRIALSECYGRVLDIGAGAGSHSLFLQKKGLDVVAIDNSPKAVEVMKRRGLKKARIGGLFDKYDKFFDTVLLLLGIGIVENLQGLGRFLDYLPSILTENGQLITDSFDIRNPDDQQYREYQKKMIAAGRYFGERTLRFEYKGEMSDWFEWMHIDPETLKNHVNKSGFSFDLIATGDKGRYLSIIKRK